MDKSQEKLFRELAVRYTELYGTRLGQEAETLNAREPANMGIRRKITQKLALRRKRQVTTVFGALAACLALFFVLRLTLPVHIPPVPGTPASAPVIPLTFSLPAEFIVKGVEQDLGQTIYFLEHAWQDDVVLTLEKPGAPPSWENFERQELHGETVYLLVRDSFSLLSFEREGLLHTLSVRHDINTLTELHQSIVKNI
jgi:hypothetical protein